MEVIPVIVFGILRSVIALQVRRQRGGCFRCSDDETPIFPSQTKDMTAMPVKMELLQLKTLAQVRS